MSYKPHRNNYKNCANINHRLNKLSTFEALKECDILITDYSAAAFEASLLGKKVIFYLWDFEEYKKIRGINLDFSTMKNVCYSKEELVSTMKNLEADSHLEKDYLNAKNDFVEFLQKSIQEYSD